MLQRIVLLMVFLLGNVSIISGQTITKSDTRVLLVELGKMLTVIPETKEECQALLQNIKAWQDKKLKELEGPKEFLRITAPPDKAQIIERPFVEGTVADSRAKVWVIVHPMAVSDYWVQPSVNVRENGTWKVQVYIGKGPIGIGEQFEIMAVANPKVELEEGNVLGGWPEAQWRSQVIEVTRR
jgi:hypothetical protein